MIRRRVVLLATVVAIAPACAHQDASQPAAVQKEFGFGRHRVQVKAPAGWEVLDQGRQKRFRNGESELVLEVLGPAAPQGVRHEVEQARDLWKAGQVDESQLRIRNMGTPPELFATATERTTFNATRVRLATLEEWTPFDRAEADFEKLLAGIEAMPPRDFAALVDWAFPSVNQDQRRDVKSRKSRTVDGRDAMDIETWSRLDHAWPQRLLFIADDGDLLVLHTPRLADAATVKAFESIRDSFHFAAAPAADSGRR